MTELIKFDIPKGHKLETTYNKLDGSIYYLTSSDFRSKWYVYGFVNGEWKKMKTSKEFIRIEEIA